MQASLQLCQQLSAREGWQTMKLLPAMPPFFQPHTRGVASTGALLTFWGPSWLGSSGAPAPSPPPLSQAGPALWPGLSLFMEPRGLSPPLSARVYSLAVFASLQSG